jgi:hypothetical protein
MQQPASKVDCLWERLTCVWKSSGFVNTYSYNIMIKTCKIPWGTPYSWATTWGASRNFKGLYHYFIRKCVSKSWTFSYAGLITSQAIYFSYCCCEPRYVHNFGRPSALLRKYNAGLSFALLFFLLFLQTHFNQNTAFSSNLTMLSAYCTIAAICELFTGRS